jgi:hypothetical protein
MHIPYSLRYCFSVLKFGNKKRSAGLGSGLLGSCVTNGAPVLRQKRLTVERRVSGSAVVVTRPAMSPPKFPVVSLPTPSLIHTVTPTRNSQHNKHRQTETVTSSFFGFERPCRAISGLGDDSDIHPLRRLLLRLSNVMADPTFNILVSPVRFCTNAKSRAGMAQSV